MIPNWFESYAVQWFDKYLAGFAGEPDLRFLQIGAFAGDASVWLLDNVLTNPTSYLFDVDTWEGSDEPEHEPLDFAEVERLYDERTAKRRTVKIRRRSSDFFRLMSDLEYFDFIYVDGDHTAAGVLSDAVHSIEQLKPGGLIAFDDYLWKSGKGRLHDPAPAIDVVADLYADRLTMIGTGLQVWFRKTG